MMDSLTAMTLFMKNLFISLAMMELLVIILSLGLGVDFTFAWDNNNNNNKNEKNPPLNFWKGTALQDKEQGVGIRDKG